MKRLKKMLVIMLFFTLFISIECTMNGKTEVNAATKKVKLSKKVVTIHIGKSKIVKLKNAPKKVKWKVANKKVVNIVKKSGKKNNVIKIKGFKAGKTKITAKCGNKKYVIKVTVKKNVVKENNEKPTIEMTTQENSNKKDESAQLPVEIKAKVLNNNLTVDDKLQVEYTITGKDVNDFTSICDMPGKLEIYESGADMWFNVPKKDKEFNRLNYNVGVFGSTSFRLDIPLIEYFDYISAGHHRYTLLVGDENITVEFDITSSKKELEITGEAVNDRIQLNEDLNLCFRASGKTENENMTYGLYPGKLEKRANGQWVELSINPEAFVVDLPFQIIGTGPDYIKIPICYYFLNVTTGHYRYTHKVGEKDVPVEFDIIE